MTVVATNTCPVHWIYTVHQGTGIIYFVQQDLKKEKYTFLWFVFHSYFWRQDKLYCNHTTLPLQFGCSVEKSLEIDCY